MRIDSIAASPDRAGRYRTQLSDGSVMRLYRQTVEDFGLCPGLDLTSEECERLLAEAGRMSAKMRAVRIVAASDVSEKDLHARLVHKGEKPEDASEAVAWMHEHELVDDRRTASRIVASCIAKGYGVSRARQALYEKRVPREYWDEALADYPAQEDRILTFLRDRIDDPTDKREVQRAVQALLRRGHSYSAIREALQRLSVETDDLPEDA